MRSANSMFLKWINKNFHIELLVVIHKFPLDINLQISIFLNYHDGGSIYMALIKQIVLLVYQIRMKL